MRVQRRQFLGGLFAAPAIVAASSIMPLSVKALLAMPPHLFGDGIHDDTVALQWLIDHNPVVDLTGMRMRLSAPITMRSDLIVRGGTWMAGPNQGCAILCPASTQRLEMHGVDVTRWADEIDAKFAGVRVEMTKQRLDLT